MSWVAEEFVGVQAGRGEDFGDAPVEALDHAVGLRTVGLDEAVGDTLGGAEPVARVDSGGRSFARGTEAVDKLLAVIGEELGDFERGGLDQAREEDLGLSDTLLGGIST
jgi:hypothetical protein